MAPLVYWLTIHECGAFFQTNHQGPIIFSSYESSQEQIHSYWFLWDENYLLPQYNGQRNVPFLSRYHLGQACKALLRYIAVASSQERVDSGSFYLSILNELQFFISNFEREQQSLVASMDKHRLLLATPYRDVNYQNLCLSSGKYR